jgi:hypothetical protein
VGKSDPDIKKEQIRFNALLEQNATGVLKFRAQDYLAYGEAWNTENYRSKGQTFSQWASGLEGIRLSTSLEFPYAIMLGEEVTPDRAREFGHAVALSIRDYFQDAQ